MYVLYIWSHFFKSDFFKSDFRYMLADKLTSKAEYFAYLNIVDTTYFLESIFFNYFLFYYLFILFFSTSYKRIMLKLFAISAGP